MQDSCIEDKPLYMGHLLYLYTKQRPYLPLILTEKSLWCSIDAHQKQSFPLQFSNLFLLILSVNIIPKILIRLSI